MTTISVSESDRGKTLHVRQGDVIVVRLGENPTTGFRWDLASEECPSLAKRGSDFESASGTAVGGGGTRVLTFEARSPGTIQLNLVLRQQWQPADAIDSMLVTICVQ